MGKGFRNFQRKLDGKKDVEPDLYFIKDVHLFVVSVNRGEVRYYFKDIFDSEEFPWTGEWRAFMNCDRVFSDNMRQQVEEWAAQLGYPETKYNSEF